MPFYTGKSKDGSDMQEVEGMHVSPNGWFWGNFPISSTEEKRMDREQYLRGRRKR